jgi:tetratricopeptide (TPR) repeat protein
MTANKKQHEALNVGEAVTRSEVFLIKNKYKIIGGVVAIVVIVAAIVLYQTLYAQPREVEASTTLARGQAYFEADQYEKALNGDSLSFEGLLRLKEDYSGTKAANLADAYIGLSYAHLGKYEEAAQALDKFSGKDQMVAPAIKGAIGNCYALLGQLDKAASMLLKAAGEADNNSLSPIFLQQAGEILIKQGKYDDAISAFTTIKDKYFRSYQAMDIDKFIERATLLKNQK